jgi:hypothetical protein
MTVSSVLNRQNGFIVFGLILEILGYWRLDAWWGVILLIVGGYLLLAGLIIYIDRSLM